MTSPQSAMLMAKAHRAIGAAKLLLGAGETEGACNRAYYAMYYAAQVALMEFKGSGLQYKTHRGLVADFGRHVVLGGHLDAEFGRSLNEVQRLRELADYLGGSPSTDDASAALDMAEKLVVAVQAIAPAHDPDLR